MRIDRVLTLMFALVLLAASLSGCAALEVSAAPASAANAPNKASEASFAAISAWNQIALDTVQVPNLPPAHRFVVISYAQAAVYDAVVAVEGRYAPYELKLHRTPRASIDAAVTAAAHDVLVHYFPAQQAALDGKRDAWLNGIPAGKAKDEGIAVGQAAAAGMIALRQGDGLGADIGFTMPAPAPGVFQLPSGTQPQVPWLSRLKPFMLNSPDQFRPGPPPDLTSQRWADDFNETKAYGASNSAVRTAEQTDIARFWSTPAADQFNAAFTKFGADHHYDAVQTARLYAMGNMVAADALIGCWDAKYHYLFWRPITAVAQADTDSNPATEPLADWTPLLATPPHPEYPSAHGCLTSAVAEVFAQLVGSDRIDVTMTSTVTGVVQKSRHFDTAGDLRNEIGNARIWAGIHYRNSTDTGVILGQKVAQWALARYFKTED